MFLSRFGLAMQFSCVIILTGGTLFAQPVKSETAYTRITVCNNSNDNFIKALIVHQDYLHQEQWVLEGWHTVGKGKCSPEIISLKGQSFYYAEPVDGKGSWRGKDKSFCVSGRQVYRRIFPDEKCIEGETLLGFRERKATDEITSITLTDASPSVADVTKPALESTYDGEDDELSALSEDAAASTAAEAKAASKKKKSALASLAGDEAETTVVDGEPKKKKKGVFDDAPETIASDAGPKWAWAKDGLFDSENSGIDPGMKRCRRDVKKVQDAYWRTEDGSVWRSSVCAKSKAKPGTDNVYKVRDLFSYWALNKQKQPVFFIFDW
jgi:uncharacterized membrane protein